MKTQISLFLAALMLISGAYARDTHQMLSIQEAMNTPAAQEKLDKNISFYFGNQKHPRVIKKLGNFMSNKKTNAFGKSDEKACNWAFLSAMLSFQDRIRNMGGNAVINIHSYYYKNDMSSSKEYECGAGNVIAGVTFTGDVVKLAK